ncbi:hypothetical protein Ddc_03252 [Ditylenchus destructor]|nr:hypothetical protein Ddc_03252 [Ditylenchus destructor]
MASNYFITPNKFISIYICLLIVLASEILSQQTSNQSNIISSQIPQNSQSYAQQANSGTSGSSEDPWGDFESWLDQFKMNVVTVIDNAGTEFKAFANTASEFIQNKTKELQEMANKTDHTNSQSYAQQANSGTSGSSEDPWGDFESWLDQFKMNVVTVIDNAGTEFKAFANTASEFIQNKTKELQEMANKTDHTVTSTLRPSTPRGF